MTLPTGSFYSDMMQGYFGGLSGSQQDQLWQTFKATNGLTSNPSVNDPKALQKFAQFIQTTYEATQVLQLSPNEVQNRQLVFNVYDILILIMRSLQQSVGVTSNTLVFLGNYMKEYSDMMARIGTSLYLASPSSTNTATVNGTDLSKWTLGYSNITMEDYITTAVANGAAPPPGVGQPALLPLTLVSDLGFDAQVYDIVTLASPDASSGVKIPLPLLGLTAAQAKALTFTFQSTSPPLVPLKVSVAADIPAAGGGTEPFSDSVTITPTSLATLTSDFQTGLQNFLNSVPSGQTKSILDLLKDPDTVLPATEPASDDGAISSIASFAGVQDTLTFNATDSSFTVSYNLQLTGPTSNAPINIPVTKTVTFDSSASLASKVDAAKSAFNDLYNTQIGTFGKVSDFMGTGTKPIHINWPNIQGTSVSILLAENPLGDSTQQAQSGAAAQARSTKNSLLQQFIQNADSRKEILSNVFDATRNQVDMSRQGISSASNILQAIIKQLSNILSGIFRAG